MIFSKLRRREQTFERRLTGKPNVPNGIRVYAVGDVHGRDDLLEKLLVKIEHDIVSRASAANHIVMLGDLIDRGPDSRGVLDRLSSFSLPGCKLHILSGNHEEVLLRLMDGEQNVLPSWLKYGGIDTLESYGADVEQIKRADEISGLSLVQATIPASHQALLRSLRDTVRIGDYLFVHAGIRPSIKLHRQSPSDLRWIRNPFLNDNTDHGFIVVHGHTISDEVVERSNRIGIDTGAYVTGRLTALGIEGEERWFIEA